jgi:hypothetical protein
MVIRRKAALCAAIFILISSAQLFGQLNQTRVLFTNGAGWFTNADGSIQSYKQIMLQDGRIVDLIVSNNANLLGTTGPTTYALSNGFIGMVVPIAYYPTDCNVATPNLGKTTGWIQCKGQWLAYNSTDDAADSKSYKKLHDVIGDQWGSITVASITYFKVPDLRGRFLVTSSNVNANIPAHVGNTFSGSVASAHNHPALFISGTTSTVTMTHVHGFNFYLGNYAVNHESSGRGSKGAAGNSITVSTAFDPTHTHTASSPTTVTTTAGSGWNDNSNQNANNEVRPENVAIVYCIYSGHELQ